MAEEDEVRTKEHESAPGDSSADDSAAGKAREEQQEVEQAREEMHRLEEEGPPEKLEDWPSGKAKYQTFGGPEGESGYEEGPTAELGPTNLRYHEDGSVTIGGEKVDNPDEYKGDPIPGGPTDERTREVDEARDPD
jgi:hypothetical protein